MGVISKLEAVNHILLMAGESLVSDLDGDSGIDTEVALFILDRAIMDFQLRGLVSNTYVKKYELTEDGVIDLPSDTLNAELISIITNDDSRRIRATSRKDSDGNIRLHNHTDNINTWDKNKEYQVAIVYSLVWDEIETTMQRSILATAARQYQLVMQGDADIDQYLGQIEAVYTFKGRSADIDDRNYSVFSSLSSTARQVFTRHSPTNDPSRFRFWRHT
jgi:hypothetical protein